MPKYPYNSLAFWLEPQKAPPYWPWRSDEERDQVWNRELPVDLPRAVQEIASLFQRWITPITDCGPEAQLLLAASLSLPNLRELLEGVSVAVLNAAEYQRPSRKRIKVVRSKKPSEEEAHTGLLCVLEAIHCISAVVAGKEDWEWIEPPDEETTDPGARRAFGVIGWAPADPFERGVAARALGKDWDREEAALLSLPSEQVLNSRLSGGLRIAAKEFLATFNRLRGNSTDAPQELTAYGRAVADLRDVASKRPTPDWRTWCTATEKVYTAGQAWRRVRWVDGHGHETNQSLRVQLLTKESRVRQYGLLMRGNGSRFRAMILLNSLNLLLSTGKRYAMKLGGKWSGAPSKRLQSLFENDIVEPGVREQWEAAMVGPLEKCGMLIRIVTRDGQQEPWTLRKHYRQFVKKGLVGGRSDATRKRRIVEELLAPMQALGLAANLPWNQLLQADSSRRKTGMRRAPATLDTCHGKSWVVNPLALVHRPRKRSGKR